jgi:hypothetical protein
MYEMAQKQGWVTISWKNHCKRIFPFAKPRSLSLRPPRSPVTALRCLEHVCSPSGRGHSENQNAAEIGREIEFLTVNADFAPD